MTLDLDPNPKGEPILLFQPDLILPAQYFNPPPKLSPEQQLMMAVLDDAVRCIEKYRFPADTQARRLFDEAKEWFLVAEPTWPYSFEGICAALGLDADAVRESLLPLPPAVPAVLGDAA